MSTVEALSYAIDDRDRLIKLDEGYYRFAEENGWDRVSDSLGRSLWDFVAGDEMRKVQRMLLRRLRDEAREVELPFRCDSPGVRREMDMRIVSHPSGRTVLFSARLSAEHSRELDQPVLDLSAPRGEETLEMCGWCDRFLVDGEWMEIEEAAIALDLFRRSELPRIDHGICPRCSSMLLAA